MADKTPGIEAPGKDSSTGYDSTEEETNVTGDAVPTELDSDKDNQTSTNYDSEIEETNVSGGSVPTDLQGPEGRQTTGYESQ